MKAKVAAAVLLAVMMSGCAGMARSGARKEAIAQCRRDGKVFSERQAGSSGGLFGNVYVAGQCLGPDDPGYAEAKLKLEGKLASDPAVR